MSRPLLAFFALVIALGIGGFLVRDQIFGAFPGLRQVDIMTEEPPVVMTSGDPSPAVATITPTASPVSSPMVQASSSPVPTALTPVVVFTPEGAFTAAQKEQIMLRVVTPYIDYHKDHPDQGKPLTITVSENLQASKNQYPFLFEAIFENGGTNGFVITRQGNSYQWFVPEGMGGCQLTPSYKQKYPEIAKLCGE